MYRSLLVPLDQSSFAEQALPLAMNIARQANARLDLVAVHTLYALKEPCAGWAPFHPQHESECKQQELHYLDAIAKRIGRNSAIEVETGLLPGSAVLSSTVAESILERAKATKADMIVMATHGLGLVGRIGHGSVADELIRHASIPVLLVRPRETPFEGNAESVRNNFVIPLDGSILAEQILEPAMELAGHMNASCLLVLVVKPSPKARVAAASAAIAESETYLERIAARMKERGLDVQSRVVVAPQPAEGIIAEAQKHSSTLIAVATHGRGGFKRLILGSVADKLVQNADVPILVYRPSPKEVPDENNTGAGELETLDVKRPLVI